MVELDGQAQIMQPSLPPYDPKRQADAVVRAFQYQFQETAIAWLELGPSEILLVEVAEDYDVQSAEGETTLTQITYASTDRRLTLASRKSREALTNFWGASNRGTDPSISLVLHTNMPPGQRVVARSRNDLCGIDDRAQAQTGADPLPLRDALKTLVKPGPLLDWLKKDPGRDEIADRLVNRVTWRTAQGAGPECAPIDYAYHEPPVGAWSTDGICT